MDLVDTLVCIPVAKSKRGRRNEKSEVTGGKEGMQRHEAQREKKHTGTVPVSLDDRFGVERAKDLKVFADTLQNVTTHHELVTGVNADAGPDLVFLLTGHDFSVDTGNVNPRIQAGLVQGLRDGSAKVVFGADTAVVGTLGTAGHATLGPTERSAFVKVKEGKLLFESKPDFLVVLTDKGFHGLGPGIGLQRLALRRVGVAHDEHIVRAVGTDTEGILKDPARLQNDFRVVTRGLVGGGSVEIPLGKGVNRLGLVSVEERKSVCKTSVGGQ
jgi:hypothetical protein